MTNRPIREGDAVEIKSAIPYSGRVHQGTTADNGETIYVVMVPMVVDASQLKVIVPVENTQELPETGV